MTEPLPNSTLRFWPFFTIALAVRLLVVVLGVLMIPIQPSQPIWVMGIGIAGYPADMRSSSDDDGPKQLRERIEASSAAVIEPWYRWDATWFAYIAQDGYAKNRGGPQGAAFPPAMPAVLAVADAIGLNPFWAGLLAANLAGAAGAALLAQIAMRLTADREVATRAFTLLLAFPSAFFFSAPYHESFGLLFTGLALMAWLDSRPVRAGVFAALGSFARIAGIAIGVATLANWLTTDRSRRGFWFAMIVAVGSFAGVVAYWGYVGWVFGNPLSGLSAHGNWGRRNFSLMNPWYAIESIYDPELRRPGMAPSFAFEGLCALGFAVLGIRAWMRRGIFWGMLTLVPVGMMLMSGTFLSGHRVVLAAAPAFIELADMLRNRLYYRLTVGFFVLAQLVLMNRYVHWQWAG
ncbi:MAG: hypothetical protein K8U57_40115 [Planctomycetes bacterium]|nr:hypothetical protein [Planctomycetota bacterium]